MKVNLLIYRTSWAGLVSVLLLWSDVATIYGTEHSQLFQNQVLDLQLRVETTDLQQLADRPEQFVRAQLQCFGENYPPVGLCLRPQVQEILRESKPSFVIKLDHVHPGLSLGGTGEFVMEHSVFDSGLLDRFVASRLAARVGVRCPIYTHARVNLNGRPIGLYSVIERLGEQFLLRTTGNATGQLVDANRISTVLQTGAERAQDSQAEFLNSLGLTLQKKGSELLPALGQIFDLDGVFRFLAWETFVRHTAGYSHSGSNGWIYVPENPQKAELLPGNLFRLFTAPKMSILGGKESLIASRLLETAEGRRRFIQAIASIATNTAIETEMVAEIEQRTALLALNLSSDAQLRELEGHSRNLEKSLHRRFDSVRQQVKELSALSDLQLASIKVPQVSVTDFVRPRKLMVSGTIPDHAGHFRRLINSAGMLTSSVPARVFEVNLSAPAGLLENLPQESTNWVPVTALCDGYRFESAGVRLKGHGSRENFQGKPNFTLKFDLQSGEDGFEGNSKLHFQNAIFNASLLNEYVASWVFRRAGLPCPRVNFAHLTVNGVDYGIMVTVEGTTKSYLRREFGEDGGVLFEGEYADIDGNLDLDSGRLPDGYDGLRRLREAASVALSTGSLDQLTNVLNLEQFIRFVAAEIALGHADGYALAANNYRFYQPGPDRPFLFLPHGMDRLAMDQQGVLPEAKGILARAVFHAPAGRDAFLAALQSLLERSIDMPQLVNDVAAISKKIHSTLRQNDPLQAPAQLGSAAALMARFGERKLYLLEQLQQVQPSSKPAPDSYRAALVR